MLQFSQYSLIAGFALTTLAMLSYIVAFARGRSVVTAPTRANAHARTAARGGVDVIERPTAARGPASHVAAIATWATHFARLAAVFLAVCMVTRAIGTGHGPFTNQYEFSVSFGFGIVAAYVFFEWRYRIRTIALLVLPVAAGMLLYALTQSATANPLVPALQNHLLLTTHVAVAVFAYGAFAVSFGAAGLYLWQVYAAPEHGVRGLPRPDVLDRLGYKAVIIGFPLLTMVIVLGAVWAEIAWGSYWSWDPKETASLVTWLIYGGYLHARVARGWVGKGAAWLLVLGFSSVILTFLGNLFFGGLHSYGAM